MISPAEEELNKLRKEIELLNEKISRLIETYSVRINLYVVEKLTAFGNVPIIKPYLRVVI